MNDQGLTPQESTTLVLDEAENLIWALLDDQLDEARATRLSKLLEEHESVRFRYIDCVRLHLDLQDHYAEAAKGAAKETAVLPLLTPDLPAGSGIPFNPTRE